VAVEVDGDAVERVAACGPQANAGVCLGYQPAWV